MSEFSEHSLLYSNDRSNSILPRWKSLLKEYLTTKRVDSVFLTNTPDHSGTDCSRTKLWGTAVGIQSPTELIHNINNVGWMEALLKEELTQWLAPWQSLFSFLYTYYLETMDLLELVSSIIFLSLMLISVFPPFYEIFLFFPSHVNSFSVYVVKFINVFLLVEFGHHKNFPTFRLQIHLPMVSFCFTFKFLIHVDFSLLYEIQM